MAKTRRYLLSRDNTLDGIKLLIGNKKDVVIVAINIHHETKELLKDYTSIIREIRGTQYQVQDVLFVLRESNLPYFVHKELDQQTVDKENYTKIDDRLNIYSAILDLSQQQYASAKERWSAEDLEGEAKVQVTIGFLTLLIYMKERDIVQLNIASRYKEQGIQNTLDDLEPLT